LRAFYLEGQDEETYRIIANYFAAVKEKLWDTADAKSYIKKTVGMQALFDVFRNLVREALGKEEEEEEEFFLEKMKQCAVVDFSDPFFRQASGTGRQRIRNCLELCLGLRTIEEITSDQENYRRLCRL
jgi:hypothetical protein